MITSRARKLCATRMIAPTANAFPKLWTATEKSLRTGERSARTSSGEASTGGKRAIVALTVAHAPQDGVRERRSPSWRQLRQRSPEALDRILTALRREVECAPPRQEPGELHLRLARSPAGSATAFTHRWPPRS